jgi:hypothetical protein
VVRKPQAPIVIAYRAGWPQTIVHICHAPRVQFHRTKFEKGRSASKLPQPNSAFAKALHKPETEKRLAEVGYAPLASSPEESTAQFRAMVQQWTAVVDRQRSRGNDGRRSGFGKLD